MDIAHNMNNTPYDSARSIAATLADNSEQLNLGIIQSIGDCVQVLDIDGRLLSMNEIGQRLLDIEDIQPYPGTRYRP